MYLKELDSEKLKKLQWQIMQNVAASAIIPLMRIGDELGLFKVLADNGPCTDEEFSNLAKIDNRYGREWLLALCAAGYCSADEDVNKFHLSPEQQAVFAFEDSPALMIGAYDVLSANVHGIDSVREAFKTGEGVHYEKFHPCCFQGTARFFKPSYAANLLKKWLPKVSGVVEKLKDGGSYADIGCGFGVSTLMVAEEFPKAEVYGFDIHKPSIQKAQSIAKEACMEKRIQYTVADAKSYAGKFDVIAFFDCLHDMGDPEGAARYAFEHLNDGGVVILIEPTASDKPSENFHTIGQMYYSFSTMGCIPTSKSQEVGLALGAQAGPKKLEDILSKAGLADPKVVHRNASNMVIEARKI